MVRRNTRSQPQKQTKKIVQTKKETKKQKIQSKKGKKQQPSESQIDEDEQQINNGKVSSVNDQNQSSSGNDQNSEGGDSSDDEQQDSSDESSSQSLAPENYAVKQMSFRQRRGTKMNYLMNKKKQEEEDPFWLNQGQNFFGDLEDQEADEDYQQSSQGRDEFDSDFGQTESEHNNEEEKKLDEPEVDQEKARERKKQQELMRKIGAPAHTHKKAALKTSSSVKKQQSDKKPIPQVINRYIHQVCTQQQLLGQAAQTEYINWLSLQKLISLQNQKKVFTHKNHFLDGQKIIFRDRINEDGKRATSYQLVGVRVDKISDLTQMLNRQGESQ